MKLASILLLLLCSWATGQDDVDEEQRLIVLDGTLSGDLFQPVPTEPPPLLRSLTHETPGAVATSRLNAMLTEPAVKKAHVVRLERSALGGGVMAIDLFDEPITVHQTARANLDPSGSMFSLEGLLSRGRDQATLEFNPRQGFKGTIVLGTRKWELLPLTESSCALVTYTTPTGNRENSESTPRKTLSKAAPSERTRSFPPLFETASEPGERDSVLGSIENRPHVERVDVLVRTRTPFSPANEGFVLSLPSVGEVLLLRLQTRPSESDGGFTWKAAVVGDTTNSASMVVTPNGCSGSLNLDGVTYEIRPVENDLHAILRLDPSRFPPDETDDDLAKPAGPPKK